MIECVECAMSFGEHSVSRVLCIIIVYNFFCPSFMLMERERERERDDDEHLWLLIIIILYYY